SIAIGKEIQRRTCLLETRPKQRCKDKQNKERGNLLLLVSLKFLEDEEVQEVNYKSTDNSIGRPVGQRYRINFDQSGYQQPYQRAQHNHSRVHAHPYQGPRAGVISFTRLFSRQSNSAES